jgi:amino acid adenylation domain-containing protein
MFGSVEGATESMDLPSALVDALLRTSREAGATLFMTLLGAFKAVLQRYTGRDDIVVGTAISGRTQPETEGLVGFFVNTLALRTDLSGDPTFRDLVARVRATALEAYAHQDLPFATLVAELGPERQSGRLPVVQIGFVFEPPLPPFAPAGLACERVEVHTGAAPFELTLFVEAVAGGLRATAEYRTALYDASMIVRLLGHWRNVLEAAAAEPERRLSELPILSEAERHQLLVAWNATRVDFPHTATLPALFEAQVARSPDASAVRGDGQTLTYRELDHRANQLAHHLRTLGVGPDVPVGLCLARSPALVIGMLGILKAGGAYVPLDPSYPAARLAFMLKDTRAPVLLTEAPLLAQLPAHAGHVLCLDRDSAAIATQPATDPPGTATAENLAYIIYTSGSTGTPKGVMVEHRAVVNYMEWMRRTFDFDHRDSVLQKTPISFDAATWEFFAPLLNGGRLVMLPSDAHRDPTAIVRALCEHEVTTVQLVPSLLRLVAQEALLAACGTLTRVFSGGEALPGAVAQSVFERCGARLYNLYGPTETCIYSLSWECRPDDARATVPIGRPIANTRVYVLDEYRQPVPVGVAGELYIGGEGLARGYWKRPELTAERFVPDPFAQRPGARMYRSGDRARYQPDGNIEFLGRLDHQLKLRGFRIEPGEIEAVLARHGGVGEALVLLREDVPGDARLVAYVVARGDAIGAADLRAWLTPLVPDYMLPSAFVLMAALPLTPNGKIDRNALPRPEARDAAVAATFVAPRGPVEEVLAAIWTGVLGVELVGVEGNFFELGGDSLLAIQVLSRLRDRLGIELSVRAFFDAPTIAELATRIGGALPEGGKHRAAPIEPAPDAT